jgi:hypothetical protein
MDYTLSEIVKHKSTIMNLSNQLINTYDVNQEISINEELIKEAQFLLSLLNIKKNFLFGQNFQNNNMNNIFNPMQNNQMNMFNNINNNQFQQMMPIQSMQNIFNNNNMNDIQEPKKEEIILLFEKQSDRRSIITIHCTPDDKLSFVFNRCVQKINSRSNRNDLKFIHNNSALNPSESVKEAGLINFSKILVYDTHKIIGG